MNVRVKELPDFTLVSHFKFNVIVTHFERNPEALGYPFQFLLFKRFLERF